MTILWPIDPVSGHPLSIEATSAAVWVRSSVDPNDFDLERKLGIEVVHSGYPVGDVRRYGALPDLKQTDTDGQR